jgi:hypothetical protein
MRWTRTPDANLTEAVERAHARASGVWTGCDWPTSFGDSGLDLNGITSHQALLMARATAGIEATDWLEAVHWLKLVEADAEAAEEAGRWAVDLARRGNFLAALREAEAACDLESRYHVICVWADLRDILAFTCSKSPAVPV